MTKLIWNGCDGYMELDRAVTLGYDVQGETLYKQHESFNAFDASEIDPDTLPLIDGERDTDGVFVTETGKYYR